MGTAGPPGRAVPSPASPSDPPPGRFASGRLKLAVGVMTSEPDRLPDEDDVDAPGQLLWISRIFPTKLFWPERVRASVLELQAVLVDAPAARFGAGDQLLRAYYDEDDVGGAPGVRGEAGYRRPGRTRRAPRRGSPHERCRWSSWPGRRSPSSLPSASRSRARSACCGSSRTVLVDRVRDAGLLERHRRVRHHGGALGD